MIVNTRRKVFRVIDKNMARCLGRVFMLAYRKGVNDAELHSDDEGMLMEHIEQTADGVKFGYVGDLTGSWVYWRNRLTDIAEERGCYKAIEGYWQAMKSFKSNYMSVALMVAQAFYNRGIQDYIKNPGAEDIALYNDKPVNWWGASGKGVTPYRLRDYVQDVCARRMDRIDRGEENPLQRCHYEIFMQAFSISIVAK